jgi:hypothetical protein
MYEAIDDIMLGVGVGVGFITILAYKKWYYSYPEP